MGQDRALDPGREGTSPAILRKSRAPGRVVLTAGPIPSLPPVIAPASGSGAAPARPPRRRLALSARPREEPQRRPALLVERRGVDDLALDHVERLAGVGPAGDGFAEDVEHAA